MSEANIEREIAPAGKTAARAGDVHPRLAQPPTNDHPLLALQRAIGNQAVQRHLRAGALPPAVLLGQQRALGNQAVQRALRARARPATPSAPTPAADDARSTAQATTPSSGPPLAAGAPETMGAGRGSGSSGVIQLTPTFTEWRRTNDKPAPGPATVSQPMIQLTPTFTDWRQINNKPAASMNTIRQEILDYWDSIQADRDRATGLVASTLKDVVGGQRTLNEYIELLDAYAETLTLILQEMDKAPELKQYATEDFIDKHVEGYGHARTANQITAERNVEISTVLDLSEAANLEKLARELETSSNKTNYFTQGGYPTTWVKNKQDQKVGVANVRITKQKDGGFDKKFNHLDPEIAWVGQEPKPTKWKRL